MPPVACGQTECLDNAGYQRITSPYLSRSLFDTEHGILLKLWQENQIPSRQRQTSSVRGGTAAVISDKAARRLPEADPTDPQRGDGRRTQSRNKGDQDEPLRVSTVVTTLELLILLLE